MSNAGKRALGGGIAGSMAMVVQVSTLMWMRTTMNYQYRYCFVQLLLVFTIVEVQLLLALLLLLLRDGKGKWQWHQLYSEVSSISFNVC